MDEKIVLPKKVQLAQTAYDALKNNGALVDQVAEELGISSFTVQHIRRAKDKRLTQINVLYILAAELECDVEDLLIDTKV